MIFRGPFLTREKYQGMSLSYLRKEFTRPRRRLAQNEYEILGCVLKKRTKRTRAPTHRIPISPRERRFAIMAYRKRCSTNLIARILTRSTSLISKWLKKAAERGILRLVDLRKMPHQVRMRTASKARSTMLKHLNAWRRYMSGELDEPP